MIRYSNRLQQAIDLICRLHESQRRIVIDVPYVSHLFGVATIVGEYTDDEDVVIAALLHDVLEDVPSELYSALDLESDFGKKVLQIVEDVSELKVSVDTQQKIPWIERKQSYLKHLREKASLDAVLVSGADKLNNWNSILNMLYSQGEVIWIYFNSDRKRQHWFMQEFLGIVRLRLGNNHPLYLKLEDLCFKILQS